MNQFVIAKAKSEAINCWIASAFCETPRNDENGASLRGNARSALYFVLLFYLPARRDEKKYDRNY